MPIGGRTAFYGVLDPILCWDLWIRLRSLDKVAVELGKRGIINPFTGRHPNSMAVRACCWRYAKDHPKEVRKKWYEPAMLENGIIVTDEMWDKELFKQVHLLCYRKPKRWEFWLSKNPDMRKYVGVLKPISDWEK